MADGAGGHSTTAAVIEPVKTKAQLEEFIAYPWAVYRGDPYWVPTFFRERMEFFDPGKNPFFAHSEVQLFLARREGRVVGTIAAIINHNHNAFHNEQVGFWGHFECIDDTVVASQLLAAAEEWVRARGMTSIRGPMNMSVNDECGLLVDGFDSAPVVMMTYNPRYYVRLVESAGYSKAMDLYAWLIKTSIYDDKPDNMPRKVLSACEKMQKEGRITIRKADLRHFASEMARAKQVYNSAWSRNWGAVPMTDAEIEHLAKGLRKFLDPDLAFFAEEDGKPVGISLGLPDVNEALLRAYPRPGASLARYVWDGLRFLWAKRRQPKIFRLTIMGVIDTHRSRGIDACFYVETARQAMAKGYKYCEMSWILETNHMMNRIIERLGGEVYKTYRVYEKAL